MRRAPRAPRAPSLSPLVPRCAVRRHGMVSTAVLGADPNLPPSPSFHSIVSLLVAESTMSSPTLSDLPKVAVDLKSQLEGFNPNNMKHAVTQEKTILPTAEGMSECRLFSQFAVGAHALYCLYSFDVGFHPWEFCEILSSCSRPTSWLVVTAHYAVVVCHPGDRCNVDLPLVIVVM